MWHHGTFVVYEGNAVLMLKLYIKWTGVTRVPWCKGMVFKREKGNKKALIQRWDSVDSKGICLN